MTGKLIFLSGYFGAGKTTLMNAAVEAIPELDFVVTYTTRPQRNGEVSGKGEYVFVNDAEFQEAKAQSKKWDETIFNNFYYGIDVEGVDTELQGGKNLIICVAPDRAVIEQMSSMYLAKPLIFWIDTNLDIANERAINQGRPERVNHRMQTSERRKEILEMVDVVFTPESDDIEENKKKFIDLILSYL
jgi:guanylate kinase